ncbi:hypothetical protein BC832DRAFT_553753 [Gaertneriomyces semiglobifer]|nr:hypothetical protein BC832DRAFT_553753 [Gaertneriomyces semiglobifer]
MSSGQDDAEKRPGASIKASNLSTLVTEDILRDLFNIVGNVIDLKLYSSPHNDGLQECLVDFEEPSAALTAIHLTGTDLGDRTLLVTAAPGHHISLANTSTATPTSPRGNGTVGSPTASHASTNTPVAAYDAPRAEETARTIYVGNIALTTTDDEIRECFQSCGQILHIKMAGAQDQSSRFAFVEFADKSAATHALTLNGVSLGDRTLKVNHSKNAINKAPKAPIVADIAMKRVAEAQARIMKKYGDGDGDAASLSEDSDSARRRRRSLSKDTYTSRRRRRRSRSRSYDRWRRRRSRSRSSSRSWRRRSRTPPRRRRSRSRSRS